MIMGYIHTNERYFSVEEQKNAICEYAETYKLGQIKLYEIPETEAILLSPLKMGDTIVISDISVLGARFEDIVVIFRALAERKVHIYSIKENLTIDTVCPHLLADSLDVCLKIYKGILSLRNTQIQANLLKIGKKRGRPYKFHIGKTVLDGRESEIKELLASGVHTSQIAKNIGVGRTTLYMFIKRKGLKVV